MYRALPSGAVFCFYSVYNEQPGVVYFSDSTRVIPLLATGRMWPQQ